MCKRIFFMLFIMFPALGFSQDKPDYLQILKNADGYNKHDLRKIPQFTYESADAPELMALRKKYNIDSIAGFSNETSKILNILHWVHNVIRHDGVEDNGIKIKNADEIITITQSKNIGVTCSELATVLNDCYLAMGFKTRKVYCMPKDNADTDPDFHVINMVYSDLEKKWIWVDPTNDAYIMDENGNLLGIDEVRKKIINNKPMIVCPEANLNRHQTVTQDDYITYITKNLYLFYCPLESKYDYETPSKNPVITYVYLLPIDYSKQTTFRSEEYEQNLHVNKINYRTTNSSSFWKLPE